MSRNLTQTSCYFCHGEVKLTGEKRPITKVDCGVYFSEYEGMIVADAECGDCEAKYLAWVDESQRRCYRRAADAERPFGDLSFRSTFNDEPGAEDMPKYRIRETVTRERVGAWASDAQWPYLERERNGSRVILVGEAADVRVVGDVPLCCERSSNPCGTDTVVVGQHCACTPCRQWQARKD